MAFNLQLGKKKMRIPPLTKAVEQPDFLLIIEINPDEAWA